MAASLSVRLIFEPLAASLYIKEAPLVGVSIEGKKYIQQDFSRADDNSCWKGDKTIERSIIWYSDKKLRENEGKRDHYY